MSLRYEFDTLFRNRYSPFEKYPDGCVWLAADRRDLVIGELMKKAYEVVPN